MRTTMDNDRAQRNRYWRFLRDVQIEFTKLTWKTEYGTLADFEYFLEQNYGIVPVMDEGRFTDSFNVVNDKKFLLTRIKYDI